MKETISTAPDSDFPVVAARAGVGPDDHGMVSLDGLFENPYPYYRELRDSGVVWVDALQRWLVTRWEDVGKVEAAREVFSAQESNSLLTRAIGHQMMREDGDAHKRLRQAAQAPLRQPGVKERTESFQRLADELIDRMIAAGDSTDLVADFCAPFSGACLAEVVGLRNTSAEDVQRWSAAIIAGASNYADDQATWEVAKAATDEIDAAVEDALAGDGPPRGSIIEALSSSDGAGSPLRFEEISSNVKVMIGGGFNEPRDAVSTTVLGLLTHSDQLAAVLADPSLWPQAVEEAMRWIAPVGAAPREVRRPVVLADTKLEPGARVMVNFSSANRDERHWDRPDIYDIHRPKGRTLSFGAGPHFCLGVWMARLQVGGIALPTLFARLPGLRLDLDRPPVMGGWVFRGALQMWLRWDEPSIHSAPAGAA